MNSPAAKNPPEGETTFGDIIIGIVGCIGAVWLIVNALYSIWRMYS